MSYDHNHSKIYGLLGKHGEPEFLRYLSCDFDITHTDLFKATIGEKAIETHRSYIRVSIPYECKKLPPKTKVSIGVCYLYCMNTRQNKINSTHNSMNPSAWDDHSVSLHQFDFENFINHISQPSLILKFTP